RIRWQASLLDDSLDAVLIWTSRRGIIYWNRAAEELYGWSASEAMGRTSHELLRTEHPKSAEETERIVLRDGRWEGALGHRTRDDRRLTVESRHVAVRAGNRTAYILEMNRDVTAQKRVERELADSAERLRRLWTSNMLGVMYSDLDGAITDANDAILQMI